MNLRLRTRKTESWRRPRPREDLPRFIHLSGQGWARGRPPTRMVSGIAGEGGAVPPALWSGLGGGLVTPVAALTCLSPLPRCDSLSMGTVPCTPYSLQQLCPLPGSLCRFSRPGSHLLQHSAKMSVLPGTLHWPLARAETPLDGKAPRAGIIGVAE